MIFRADLDRSHQKSSTNHGDLIGKVGKVCFFNAATISWVNMVNYPYDCCRWLVGLPATHFLDAATLRLVLCVSQGTQKRNFLRM